MHSIFVVVRILYVVPQLLGQRKCKLYSTVSKLLCSRSTASIRAVILSADAVRAAINKLLGQFAFDMLFKELLTARTRKNSSHLRAPE